MSDARASRDSVRLHETIEMEQAGRFYDLRNDYQFTGLHQDVRAQSLELVWAPRQGDPKPCEPPSRLVLRFVGTTLVYVGPRDSAIPFAEASTLDHLGYLPPDEPPDSEWFLMEDLKRGDPRPCPAVFSFRGGQQIVVLAAEMHLELSG